MNTGFLRHAVATVLTVYGIETDYTFLSSKVADFMLQQCLPFTVLKLQHTLLHLVLLLLLQQCLPFTVLKRSIVLSLSQ